METMQGEGKYQDQLYKHLQYSLAIPVACAKQFPAPKHLQKNQKNPKQTNKQKTTLLGF